MTNRQVAAAFVKGHKSYPNDKPFTTDGEMATTYGQPFARRVVKGDTVSVLVLQKLPTVSKTSSRHKTLVCAACAHASIPVVPVLSLDQSTPMEEDTDQDPVEPCGRCYCGKFVTEEFPWCCPEDGDLVTMDYSTWSVLNHPSGRSVLKVERPHDIEDTEEDCELLGLDFPAERWQVRVKQYMDQTQFWPNVWYQGERGEWNLLSIETGQFLSEEKGQQ